MTIAHCRVERDAQTCKYCGKDATQISATTWWCTGCWQGSQIKRLTKVMRSLDQTSEMPNLLHLRLLATTRLLDRTQRTDFFSHLERIEAAHRHNFASAWRGCEPELQAIRSAEPSRKLDALHRWFDRWLCELRKLRRQVTESLAYMPDIYGITLSERGEWIAEVSELLWTRLARPYRTWIIAASFEPGSITAPFWLHQSPGELALGVSEEQVLSGLEAQLDTRLRPAPSRNDRDATSGQLATALSEVGRLASHVERRLQEHSLSPSKRRKTNPQPLDPRKVQIAQIKARHPGIPCRDVSRMMDESIERVSYVAQRQLQPLESWKRKAPGKRTWVDFHDDKRTTKAVVKYVSLIPPFRSTKQPKLRPLV